MILAFLHEFHHFMPFFFDKLIVVNLIIKLFTTYWMYNCRMMKKTSNKLKIPYVSILSHTTTIKTIVVHSNRIQIYGKSIGKKHHDRRHSYHIILFVVFFYTSTQLLEFYFWSSFILFLFRFFEQTSHTRHAWVRKYLSYNPRHEKYFSFIKNAVWMCMSS